MIPDTVLQALQRAPMPCFVYDPVAITHRAALAASLLDGCFFPIKACPEPEVVRAALSTGCGLDLCSEGDAQIAAAVGCPGARWTFTAAHVSDTLLGILAAAGARFDADSLDQALRWRACGGKVCGLRITPRQPRSLYGPKFGVPVAQIVGAVHRLTAAGVSVEGLLVHDQHANLRPADFAARLAEDLGAVDREVLRDCRYVNIGGSWPMRHGNPASVGELQSAMAELRQRLNGLGFQGALFGEPGRWVVGPCGYWAARVGALKPHPLGANHRVVVLDTNTPVPCKPSLGAFAVLRNGVLLQADRCLSCDLYGSANTALDLIGRAVRLPPLALGDVVVSLGQGAYTRALIPPFNERERPTAVVLNGYSGLATG